MDNLPQGVTLGHDPFVHAIRMKLQSYLYEFVDVYEPPTIMLPYLFSIDAFDKISTKVMLIDPVGNQFEVLVKKHKSRVFLTHGTKRIGQMDNLLQGGWLTFIYLNEKTMFMEVRDRLGEQVVYPTPPKSFYLGEMSNPITLDEEKALQVANSQQPQPEDLFYHSYVKTLSVPEVTTDVLSISGGFVQHTIKRIATEMQIVDDKGKTWPCIIEWEEDSDWRCKLTSGCIEFVKGHGLNVGTTFYLGLPKEVGDKIYFKLF